MYLFIYDGRVFVNVQMTFFPLKFVIYCVPFRGGGVHGWGGGGGAGECVYCISLCIFPNPSFLQQKRSGKTRAVCVLLGNLSFSFVLLYMYLMESCLEHTGKS